MATIRFGTWAVALLLVMEQAFTAGLPQEELKSLDEQVQEIKKDVLDQTAQLRRLEEKLLFPSNTQVSFFVSVQSKAFALQSVELKVNNKVVSKYLYDHREQDALKKGGVQRIYTGNVRTGGHQLQVSVSGKSSDSGEYSRNASYQFNKGVGPKFVEIKISGPAEIKFQDW